MACLAIGHDASLLSIEWSIRLKQTPYSSLSSAITTDRFTSNAWRISGARLVARRLMRLLSLSLKISKVKTTMARFLQKVAPRHHQRFQLLWRQAWTAF